MSRFAKGSGANNNKNDQQLTLSSDDEYDEDKGSRGGSRDAGTRFQETTATPFTSLGG